MSRTNTNTKRNPNPVNLYISFNGDGNFVYWDAKQQGRASFGPSIDLVLMDTRSTIAGFSKADNARIYANRVSALTKERLVVKAGEKVIAEGMYADIKNDIKAAGGKFATEAYALVVVDGELRPATITFTGEALRCWMDFMDEIGGKYAAYAYLVTASKGEEKKAGKNSYFSVKFSMSDLPAEYAEAANAFNDDYLQPFLGPKVTVEDDVEMHQEPVEAA